ncbi:hypothetical protein FEM03_20725 [Phragmitibacter flavus]|uniref:Uncharacterized protein n=1 Tax=Phragmitibacter flavus TaxID=2576071 RepID=A0A5R8K8Z8_9BACT|nr:hypothetical protein [Phragmitibacter flavus]TLD68761.1 hypothetical protein FEM03_20725 [Phragmitibacter flavus]
MSSLNAGQKKAVQEYVAESKASLAKLLVILNRGQGAGNWRSACRDAQSLLQGLRDDKHITPALQKWWDDEEIAWERMEVAGGAVAAANEKLLEFLDIVEMDTKRSELEIETMFESMKKNVDHQIKQLTDGVKDVNDGAKVMEEVREFHELSKTELSEVAESWGLMNMGTSFVMNWMNRITATEKAMFRMADSLSRNKVRYATEQERELEAYRRMLDRLVNEKIDPDGRGAFHEVEKKMDAMVEKNLDAYRKAVEKWRAVNGPLLENAKVYFNEVVIPFANSEVGTALTVVGPKTIARVMVGVGTADEALSDFAKRVHDACRELTDRRSGEIHQKRLEVIMNNEERRDILTEAEHPVQDGRLKRALWEKEDDVTEAMEKALEPLESKKEKLLDQIASADVDQKQLAQWRFELQGVEKEMEFKKAGAAREKASIRSGWYARERAALDKKQKDELAAIDLQIKEANALKKVGG